MATDSGTREYFARWLDLTMENRGITGSYLAKKLKVTDAAVSRWRNGAGLPRLDLVLKLGKLLNVEPLRVAATAGYLDGQVDRLPMPEPTERRLKVKRALSSIPGLTTRERQKLIDTYDQEFADA